MNDDPIVEEIREYRRQVWEECGQDMSRYLDHLRSKGIECRRNLGIEEPSGNSIDSAVKHESQDEAVAGRSQAD